jgi:hypothetical protein
MKIKCPHCGNRDPKKLEDNGVRPNHPDYTVLCVARVLPKDDSFGGDGSVPEADGKVPCGMQWCPNQD